jgi:hypothetical protein
VRRVIDTTNALESVPARIRKIIKTRGQFPNDDAALKLIWLALRNITADWGRPVHHWKAASRHRAKIKTASHTEFLTLPRRPRLRRSKPQRKRQKRSQSMRLLPNPR